MKTFSKRNNKKFFAGFVTVLSAVAVVSTGFASWVISANDSKDVAGNIVVDSVSNQMHTVTLGTPSVSEIKFGTVSTGDICSWLKNDDIGAQVLTFTVSVSVANVASDPGSASAILTDATFDVGTGNAETWTSTKASSWDAIADGTATEEGVGGANAHFASGKGLVANPTLTYTAAAGAYDSVSKSYSATLNVTFGWGQLFGGNNPMNYYAGKDVKTYGQEATARLDALNTALASKKYKITVASK